MTKIELIARIAEKSNLTKASAEMALNALLASISEDLASNGKITLTGFGTFAVASRAARTGRNPMTGQEIQIPASKAVRFSVGKVLKEAVK